MKCSINNVNNVLEVSRGKSSRLYYLSRNIICKVEKLRFSDLLNFKKKILSYVSEFSDDKDMLFHYEIIFDSNFYLIIYCVKQQMKDAGLLSRSDIFPVQFLINKIYGRKSIKDKILCIIYKLESSIYILYSRKKAILYCRIVDEKSIVLTEDIVKKDIEMINNDLGHKYSFNIITNVPELKVSDNITKYLEDDIDVVSV